MLVSVTAPAARAALALDQRAGWTVTADSEELVGENGAAANVLDGDPATLWHTEWKGTVAPLPHTLTIDMRATNAVEALTYTPRPSSGGRNGTIGQYRVETSADATAWVLAVAGTMADTSAVKTLTFPTTTVRYVRLVAVSEAGNRGPWSSAAELDLTLHAATALPPRSTWTATADSEETARENGAAVNALDGDPATIWHTAWSADSPAYPHTLTIDTKAQRTVTALTYRPRPAGSSNGRIGTYRVETSIDGAMWSPAASGTFADVSTPTTVTFAARTGRYVRLVGLTEAGGRGPWASAGEVDLTSTAPEPTPSATPDPTPSEPTPTPTPSPTLTGVPTRDQWLVTADSEELVGENGAAANVLDGDPATYWHTQWTNGVASLPHTLTIDTLVARRLSGLTVKPRLSATGANGRIGSYRVELSSDGTTWTIAATGAFADSAVVKTLGFTPTEARHVRLVALSEAGGRGPWSSVAEIDVVTTDPDTNAQGSWSGVTGLPIVPVAGAVLPSGEVLTWASSKADAVGQLGRGFTEFAIFDPATGTSTARRVAETGHDMFCPGIVFLADGSLVVQGGSNADVASRYDPGTKTWTTTQPLAIPRGYQSAVTLADGSVFTIGGSWSGGLGGKDGELWTPTSSRALPGALVAPMLTDDARGIFGADNHAWLFTWKDNKVFQAGPSKAMNWYDVTGDGATTPAGLRGDDNHAMNGSAVMYDAGKILTIGGAPDYTDSVATANANLIDITGGSPVVTKLDSMHSARAYGYAIALPDGTVLVSGGQAYAKTYTDATAAMRPELFDPATNTFTELAAMSVPRNYHSFALLLPDARVLVGGGGLCDGCGFDHADVEIFTPPYLAGKETTRPKITAAPPAAAAGSTLTVTTDRPVSSFSLVRMSSSTHSVNTDQRRIALTPVNNADGTTSLTLPADSGVVPPGPWMLFAMDAQGVPSVASTMLLS